MVEWIDELAAALEVDPLTADETRDLLGAARDVAHRAERKITPLSTFLVGIAVGRADAAGTQRTQALAGALRSVRTILPADTDEPDPD